jgi:hypothetical protein
VRALIRRDPAPRPSVLEVGPLRLSLPVAPGRSQAPFVDVREPGRV